LAAKKRYAIEGHNLDDHLFQKEVVVELEHHLSLFLSLSMETGHIGWLWVEFFGEERAAYHLPDPIFPRNAGVPNKPWNSCWLGL
jgi:hypothetical protein